MKTTKKKKRTTKQKRPVWELHLYVADTTPRSVLATGNLRTLCEQHLEGNYRITVIDIMKRPDAAREHNVVATPTLVRVLPGPEKTLIGTLADTEQVLRALDVSKNHAELASLLPAGMPQIGHA